MLSYIILSNDGESTNKHKNLYLLRNQILDIIDNMTTNINTNMNLNENLESLVTIESNESIKKSNETSSNVYSDILSAINSNSNSNDHNDMTTFYEGSSDMFEPTNYQGVPYKIFKDFYPYDQYKNNMACIHIGKNSFEIFSMLNKTYSPSKCKQYFCLDPDNESDYNDKMRSEQYLYKNREIKPPNDTNLFHKDNINHFRNTSIIKLSSKYSKCNLVTMNTLNLFQTTTALFTAPSFLSKDGSALITTYMHFETEFIHALSYFVDKFESVRLYADYKSTGMYDSRGNEIKKIILHILGEYLIKRIPETEYMKISSDKQRYMQTCGQLHTGELSEYIKRLFIMK